jgi:hypothetical protein
MCGRGEVRALRESGAEEANLGKLGVIDAEGTLLYILQGHPAVPEETYRLVAAPAPGFDHAEIVAFEVEVEPAAMSFGGEYTTGWKIRDMEIRDQTAFLACRSTPCFVCPVFVVAAVTVLWAVGCGGYGLSHASHTIMTLSN